MTALMVDSFRCHVCGENRPDALIGVVSRRDGIWTENLRFCTDRGECRNEANAWALRAVGSPWPKFSANVAAHLGFREFVGGLLDVPGMRAFLVGVSCCLALCVLGLVLVAWRGGLL